MRPSDTKNVLPSHRAAGRVDGTDLRLAVRILVQQLGFQAPHGSKVGSAEIWRFPIIGVLNWGSQYLRSKILLGLYRGPPILGNYHMEISICRPTLP